jgi:hypothetical protein
MAGAAPGLSSHRKIGDVMSTVSNRDPDFMERSYVRVDVTAEFSFLVTKLSPHSGR